MEMKKRGFTSTELARRSDVLTSFIYDIISGKSSNPSTVKLARVAEALGVSLTCLVSGAEAEPAATSGNGANENCVTIPRIAVNGSGQGEMVISHEESAEAYFFNSLWIRSHLNANTADLRMMIIEGDAMEPALLHNDIILIDTSKKHPSPPGIFILFDGMGLKAQRLEYLPPSGSLHVRVISDNRHYSTYECSISEISIIGRVIWFSREI
jgi:phage repressor protein C with HTH and peptisase S24 domain